MGFASTLHPPYVIVTECFVVCDRSGFRSKDEWNRAMPSSGFAIRYIFC